MKEALDLPPEIWIQILNQLEKIDVAQVSLVSKQFLSLTNYTCKTLILFPETLKVLPRVLQRFQYLESFIIFTDSTSFDSLCQDYSSSESGQEASKRVKRLNCLNKSGFFLPEITKILTLFPWLEEISFGYSPNSVPVKRCPELERMTSMLTMLKKVTFECDYYLTDECLTFISSTCLNLEEIHIELRHYSRFRIGEKTIGFILRHSPKLTTLTLPLIHKCLPDDPLSMANSMPYAKHLHTLWLFGPNLSIELTHSLAIRNASLKKLKIHFDYWTRGKLVDIQNNHLPPIFRECCSIEDVCIKSNGQLTDSLIELISPSLTKLTRIDLDHSSKLSNPSFSALTKYCPLLEKMNVTWAGIGLGEMSLTNLHKHNKLGKLCLEGNKYLDNETLKIMIWMCPKLQYLDVSKCSSLKRDGVLEILRTCDVDLLTVLKLNSVPSEFRIYPEGSRIVNLKKLEVQGKVSKNDKTLGEIGKLCSGLEFLDGIVTNTRVIEVMKNFKNLKSIKFHYGQPSGVCSFLVSQEQRKLFLVKKGCNIDYHSPLFCF